MGAGLAGAGLRRSGHRLVSPGRYPSRSRRAGLAVSRTAFHERAMALSLDQALLYLVDLRLQLRASPEGRAIVDRCLTLLTAARTADADTAQLEAEVEVLRQELLLRFGPRPPLKVH